MKSAARSPIMLTGAWVLQLGMIGITEASAMRRPSTPHSAGTIKARFRRGIPVEPIGIGLGGRQVHHEIDRVDKVADVLRLAEEIRLNLDRRPWLRPEQAQ